MKRPWIGLLCLLAPLIAAATTVSPPPLPGNSLYQTPLTLSDQTGKRFTLLSLRGRPIIVGMFYASCTDVCPLTINVAEQTRRAASVPGHQQFSVLMISFDPAHDSVAKLANIMHMHQLDSSHWRLARPEAGDVDTFAATLGVAFRARKNGDFTHNAVLVLLDSNGRIVSRTSNAQTLDQTFVDAIRRWSIYH